MANEGTEKATPQKRRKEREKGNVANSKEMNNFLTLSALAVVVFFYAKPLAMGMVQMIEKLFAMIAGGSDPLEFLGVAFKEAFNLLIPIFIIGTFFHVLNYVMQVNFLFSMKIITPDFKRMNPANYFKNLFSRKTIVQIIKSFLLMILLGLAGYMVLNNKVGMIAEAVWLPWQMSLIKIVSLFKVAFGALLIVLGVIGTFDYVYQRWEYEQKIKMKKEDITRESKDSEGDPRMKGRMKEFMFALMESDFAKVVPEANFIINNPTHISVAIRYKKGQDEVPILVAKGEERVALYIRTLAKDHKIPMIENKPLARSIYANVDIGNPINEEMYEAVIEVMKYLILTNEMENDF